MESLITQRYFITVLCITEYTCVCLNESNITCQKNKQYLFLVSEFAQHTLAIAYKPIKSAISEIVEIFTQNLKFCFDAKYLKIMSMVFALFLKRNFEHGGKQSNFIIFCCWYSFNNPCIFFLFHKQEQAKLHRLSSWRRDFSTFLIVNIYLLADVYQLYLHEGQYFNFKL